MNLITINVKRTFNIGNYESLQFGGEWSADNRSLSEQLADAEAQLVEAFKLATGKIENVPRGTITEDSKEQPKEQPKVAENVPRGTMEEPKPDKPVLQLGTPKFKSAFLAVRQKRATLEDVKKYYTITPQMEELFRSAETLNLNEILDK